jgi:hypothetical protein
MDQKFVRAPILSHVLLEPTQAGSGTGIQDGWAVCSRCLQICYTGHGGGACAANGPHDCSTSPGYGLAYNTVPAPGTQVNWRWCSKCQALAYGGFGPAPCPAGGNHELRSLNYALSYRSDVGVGGGGGWRWCKLCQGLVRVPDGPERGPCIAGGKHAVVTEPGAYEYNVRVLRPGANAPLETIRPQLFLVETYQLTTYMGDLLRGEMVGFPISVEAQSERTVTTTRTTTTSADVASSETVLDSASEQSASTFNSNVHESSDQASSAESYDYKMNANFHGEGSIGFGSASADAHLDVAGSTNDVRQQFATAVSSALDKQVTRANQAVRQQVSATTEDVKKSESVSIQMSETIRNTTAERRQYAPFLLTSEYVVLLSLIDVQVGFRNGDPHQDRTEPLFKLDALLEDVVASPEECKAIRDQIRASLEKVRDHTDQPRSVVVPDRASPNGFVFAKELESKVDLKNADGSVRRTLSAPGVVVQWYRQFVRRPYTITLDLVAR